MSGGAPGDAFDARMRRHFARIDTAPGFEARLAARLAAVRSEAPEALRARLARWRALEAQRLRGEVWTRIASTAGVGAAAIALVWRHAPTVARGVEGLLATTSDPLMATIVAAAVIALGAWPVLQRFVPR